MDGFENFVKTSASDKRGFTFTKHLLSEMLGGAVAKRTNISLKCYASFGFSLRGFVIRRLCGSAILSGAVLNCGSRKGLLRHFSTY